MPKLVGSVVFNEEGNAGQLLTTELKAGSPRIWSFVEFNQKTLTHGNTKLDQASLVMLKNGSVPENLHKSKQ